MHSPDLQPTTDNSSGTLIVGAGLAGCSLAWRLQQANQPFHLLGSSQMPSAAKVAAGIINPVTGRWMTKSWRFDDFAPEAADFYGEIERRFDITLYHPLPATRFCLNAEDAKRAKRRCRNPRYANVLQGFHEAGQESSPFTNPHGRISIKGVAYVNLPRFIKTLQSHFQSGGHYEDKVFEYQQLEKTKGGWAYGGRHYRKVFFCEGSALKANPWFRNLPLTPARGETLLCRSEDLQIEPELYHHGKWLLPYPDGNFRIGATYDEDDLREEPTREGRETLVQAFRAMTREAHPLDILDQPTGIRPSTSDARPLIGQHPKEPGLYVFNGLGSKGASLAPTLSRELMNFAFHEVSLDQDTDIRRFD